MADPSKRRKTSSASSKASRAKSPRRRPSGPRDDEITDPLLLESTQQYLEAKLSGLATTPLSEQAWQKFYEVYGPLVRRFAVSCRVGAGEIDDCVQEVLSSVIKSLSKFDYEPGRGRFRAWLFTIVRNQSTDMVRRRNRRLARNLRRAEEQSLTDPGDGPLRRLEKRWNRQLVRAVTEVLEQNVSPRDFEIFRLRSIEGVRTAEVARRLETTPERVRYRYHRVKQKFRRIFQAYTGEEYSIDF